MTGFIFLLYAGVRINDVIQLKGVFHSTFHDTGDKSPLLFVKILVFAQCLAQYNMAVTALFQDLEQDIQNYFRLLFPLVIVSSSSEQNHETEQLKHGSGQSRHIRERRAPSTFLV